MMRSAMRGFRTAALVVLVLGCGGDDPSGPSGPELDGTWLGISGDWTLNMTLNEGNGNITGDGILSLGNHHAALTLTGTVDGSSVAMTATAPGFEPMDVSVTVDGSTMTGTIDGAAFDQAPFTATRE